MDKTNVRVFFEKKDRAIYISHLDLLRTMQRALKRSGLPAWYSEGFNPRIYLNFPLALSLGVIGEREPMDFGVTENVSLEDIRDKLNAACPEGIRIISAAYPLHLNKDIGFGEYSLEFEGNGLDKALEAFMAQENIPVTKRTKKGETEIDLKPHIELMETIPHDKGITVSLRLPAGNTLNINPSVFSDAFTGFCGNLNINCLLRCTKRTNILCADRKDFA